MTEGKTDWELIRHLLPRDIKPSQLYYRITQCKKYEDDIELKQRALERAKQYHYECRKNIEMRIKDHTQKKAENLRTKFLNERIIVYFD